MKNFISLDVPFQIPTFKLSRELKQATSTKAHFYTLFYAGYLGRVLLNRPEQFHS